MKKIITILFAIPSFIFAQIPAGYYNSAQGLTGEALKIVLHNIIDNHTVISYNALHNAYQNTDKLPSGKVWDIYSDIPGSTAAYYFTFGTDQCGSYAVEGDCYNREHTWPQSWFSSVAGPQSDLFHVMPTDGKVNGERDNFPYGNVGSPTYFTSTNGSLLGITTDLGYNSVVFEPIDAYKGDVARNYFYMSTRYYLEDNSWVNSAATEKSNIKPWQLNVLLTWHHQDPVSQKEIDRNNKIYTSYQNNRNPFIDHPEWADSIWAETVEAFISSVGNIGLEKEKFTVYPNPFDNEFLIVLNSNHEVSSIQLYDIQGNSIPVEYTLTNNQIKINAQELEKGIYFVKVNDSSEVIQVVKI